MPTQSTHIVIIGTGFGGSTAFLHLNKLINDGAHVEVTIIGDKDRFLFSPLLHEVAAGNLQPESIALPLLTFPQRLVRDIITSAYVEEIDFDSRTVSYSQINTDGQKHEVCLSYDYLIIATGTKVNYFNVKGAQENALPLKFLDDARNIKNKLLDLFDEAENIEDTTLIQNKLRVIIAGGGPTGVELAGELSDFMRKELRQAYPLSSQNSSIVLVEAGPRLVSMLDPWFSEKISDILITKGNVSISTGTSIEEVGENFAVIGDEKIECGMTIWSGGVTPQLPHLSARKSLNYDEKTRRLMVTKELNIEAYPEVFIVGDVAGAIDNETQKLYPQRAQFAVQQARTATENIIHLMENSILQQFQGRDSGIIISLGSGSAVAQVGGLKFRGPAAWFMYRAIYLSKLPGARLKFRTALEWIMNLFTPRDISKI